MTCAKQTTIAIIKSHNRFYVGSNWCGNPQEECPRKDMKTGEGYELCKSICEQTNHAEVDACLSAGSDADGGDLYLIGHYYCCDNCKKTMAVYGIKNIYIFDENKHKLKE